MYEKLGQFILRWRVPVLIVILALTGFFAWKATLVPVESPTIDLFPSDHPYVETFVKYKDIFGGASTVLIALEVKDGDIYNLDTLAKIKRITKELELLPAINNYQVLSIAQRKVKTLRVDNERGFRGVPVMWPDIPEDEEGIEKLRTTILTSPRYNGTLVSLDGKAALILAGFFEHKMDIQEVFAGIDKIVEAERDDKTALHVIGRPFLLGHILSQSPQIQNLFFMTVFSILFVLLLYFRDLRGTIIPLTTAGVSAVWGLGFLGVLGYNFDPLVIVIPFIISARALSHSVQVVERFGEEYVIHKDRTIASAKTFAGLFGPGMVAIITDAAGVFLVWFTPIPLLQKLALMGSFWVLSIVVSDMILNPILLSFFPPPNPDKLSKRGIFDFALHQVSKLCFGKARIGVMIIAVAVFIVGYVFTSRLVIGDVHVGTPMLWPDSEYNQATFRIAELFNNTEQMTVVIEGKTRGAIKDPEVLRTMDAFQKHMEQLDEVSSTASIADLLPGIISILHGSDPKWEMIPDDPQATGFFLELIYTNSEPSDLVRFITNDRQNANITLYLKDHKGTTLRKVLAHAKTFIESHPMQQANFRLAGGFGGLLAAINEVVAWHQAQVTVFAFGIIVIFCGLAYRSVLAGLLFMLPLLISNYLTYALMGYKGIGLDVNVLPVVALGVGLGVDYGLYVVGRIKEEYRETQDLDEAVVKGITTAGRAVAFTATTMVAGVVFWTFSFLRFQAEMGLLLVFWMIVSMLGGLILLPALVAWFKPKFITKP